MGTLTFEFPDFWIFSSIYCIKDIFGKGDLYILTGYRMQEHASLAVLLETQMHLRYSYVKLDKNSLSFDANSKASYLERVFLQKFTEQLASGTLCLPGKSTYQFWGNWPSFSTLAPYNRKERKMELDYKHRFMTCHQKLKTERFLSDLKKKTTKYKKISKVLKHKK